MPRNTEAIPEQPIIWLNHISHASAVCSTVKHISSAINIWQITPMKRPIGKIRAANQMVKFLWISQRNVQKLAHIMIGVDTGRGINGNPKGWHPRRSSKCVPSLRAFPELLISYSLKSSGRPRHFSASDQSFLR